MLFSSDSDYYSDVRFQRIRYFDNESANETIISADQLQAGSIKSINGSDSGIEGTKIDLNKGDIRARDSKGYRLTTTRGNFDFSTAAIPAQDDGIVFPDVDHPSPQSGGNGSSGGGAYDTSDDNPN